MSSVPPHARLIQMATAYWVSRLLYAAARCGLADRLVDGPRTATELAAETSTHAPSLHRLMRALSSLGVLVSRSGPADGELMLGEAPVEFGDQHCRDESKLEDHGQDREDQVGK